MSFLREIKRRKVFQVAAVYAVVAWLTVQVVGAINEPLNLPVWLDTVVIVLLAVGFPIAVILAWAFDITPEGVRASPEAGVRAGRQHTAGSTFSYIAQGLVLLAVAFLVIDQYVLTSAPGTAASAAGPLTVQRISRVTIDVSSTGRLSADPEPAIAISPDGTKIVYVVDSGDDEPALYLRRLDSFGAVALRGTENAELPFFSPDGRWIGFWADGKLRKIAVDGGTPIDIAAAPIGYRGASWGANDVIVLGGSNTGLQKVSAVGGDTLEPITTIDPTANEDYHAWPQILPGGEAVVFTVHRTGADQDWNLGLLALGENSWTPLPGTQGATQPQYVHTGHIASGRSGTISTLGFDLASLTLTGSSEPAVDAVHTRFHSGMALTEFAVSNNGTLIYVGANSAEDEIVAFDRDGTRAVVNGTNVAHAYGIALARDDNQLAFTYNDALVSSDIWLKDLRRGTPRRLTTTGSNIQPQWMPPDDDRIAYSSFRDGSFDLYAIPVDGSASEPELLLRRPYDQRVTSFSSDGGTLFYGEQHPETAGDIWALRIGDDEPMPLLTSRFDERGPVLSPDDRYLAYASSESNRMEIWVMPYPGPGRRQQITVAGGEFPVWSSDSAEIFYLSDRHLMSVPVDVGEAFDWDTPIQLFELPELAAREFTVSQDGQRFFMIMDNQAPLREVSVVLGWSAELTNP